MAQEFDDLIFNIRNVTLGTSSGSSTYGGGKLPWGFLRFSLSDSPLQSNTTPIPPYAIDPPIPPVWPTLGAGRFSSDTVYGKERMNTNLRMVKGDNYVFEVVAILDGAAVNLTNYSIKLTCKKNLNDAAPFFQLTSTPVNGITITDPTNGKFTCTIAGSLTSSLPYYVQRFPYDIEIELSGNKNTLSRGYLIIVPDVS
ncbi:hypothetical protein UFOVP434_64 [uncultured Caudovirales phage]|uniref:Uncharacterized protein n=1 Tax=uncultured Caudovirales phage TaxID=2100421 RepID=A0A6J5M7I4_9CAUD|nr:hypothetical protein UFOVP434_64 [uncultured Caudovirales phage]